MKFLKFLLFAIFSMTLAVSCDGFGGDEAGDDNNDGDDTTTNTLTASVSPRVILADGADTAVIDVRFNGEPVDVEEVTFYDDSDNPLDWTSYNYTTTTVGNVRFWVAYQTYNTRNKMLTITAVDELPDAETDPDPNNTSFVHRSLLVDFTSVKCTYCPYITNVFRSLGDDEKWSERVVLAALHCKGMGTDPFVPSNAEDVERWLGVSGYPTVFIDWSQSTSGTYRELNRDKQLITGYVEKLQKNPAKGGIAAKLKLEDNKLQVVATVKAAETVAFRIGGMLLEDGLYANQTSGNLIEDGNRHDHVVRIIDAQNGSDFFGHQLGTINDGATQTYLFDWTLEEEWNLANCSVVLYISVPDGRTFVVTNAVHIDGLSGTYPFEYTE